MAIFLLGLFCSAGTTTTTTTTTTTMYQAEPLALLLPSLFHVFTVLFLQTKAKPEKLKVHCMKWCVEQIIRSISLHMRNIIPYFCQKETSNRVGKDMEVMTLLQ